MKRWWHDKCETRVNNQLENKRWMARSRCDERQRPRCTGGNSTMIGSCGTRGDDATRGRLVDETAAETRVPYLLLIYSECSVPPPKCIVLIPM
jgi:hypothetical protein